MNIFMVGLLVGRGEMLALGLLLLLAWKHLWFQVVMFVFTVRAHHRQSARVSKHAAERGIKSTSVAT